LLTGFGGLDLEVFGESTGKPPPVRIPSEHVRCAYHMSGN